MTGDDLTIEPEGSSDHSPCECCGNVSRTVWGGLNKADHTVAVFFVHWTLGRMDHGATFDLVIGPWGDGTSPKDRSVVTVMFRWTPDGPQFMVTDAAGRPAAEPGALADRALRRDEVIGTPLAKDVFAMLDAIWLKDDRIRELTRGGT